MALFLQDCNSWQHLFFLACSIAFGYVVGFGFSEYLKGGGVIWMTMNVAGCVATSRPLCSRPGEAVFIALLMAIVFSSLAFWYYWLLVLYYRFPSVSSNQTVQNSTTLIKQGSSNGSTGPYSTSTQPGSNSTAYSMLVEEGNGTGNERTEPSFMTSHFAALLARENSMNACLAEYKAKADFWYCFGRGISFVNIVLPSLSVSLLALIDPDHVNPSEKLAKLPGGSAASNVWAMAGNTTLSMEEDANDSMKVRQMRNLLICIFSVLTVLSTAVTKAIIPDQHYGIYNAKVVDVEKKIDTFKSQINSAGITSQHESSTA